MTPRQNEFLHNCNQQVDAYDAYDAYENDIKNFNKQNGFQQ